MIYAIKHEEKQMSFDVTKTVPTSTQLADGTDGLTGRVRIILVDRFGEAENKETGVKNARDIWNRYTQEEGWVRTK